MSTQPLPPGFTRPRNHLDVLDADRTPAPTLSPREAAVVARFERGEAAPESVRETVARAIFEADFCADQVVTWENDVESNREDYRALADAAIDALRGRS